MNPFPSSFKEIFFLIKDQRFFDNFGALMKGILVFSLEGIAKEAWKIFLKEKIFMAIFLSHRNFQSVIFRDISLLTKCILFSEGEKNPERAFLKERILGLWKWNQTPSLLELFVKFLLLKKIRLLSFFFRKKKNHF